MHSSSQHRGQLRFRGSVSRLLSENLGRNSWLSSCQTGTSWRNEVASHRAYACRGAHHVRRQHHTTSSFHVRKPICLYFSKADICLQSFAYRDVFTDFVVLAPAKCRMMGRCTVQQSLSNFCCCRVGQASIAPLPGVVQLSVLGVYRMEQMQLSAWLHWHYWCPAAAALLKLCFELFSYAMLKGVLTTCTSACILFAALA